MTLSEAITHAKMLVKADHTDRYVTYDSNSHADPGNRYTVKVAYDWPYEHPDNKCYICWGLTPIGYGIITHTWEV